MSPSRILIVEDDAIAAMDIKRRLDLFGYDVLGTASRGEEAVQLALSLRPDLILMDIILKGEMDGITVSEEIKELEIPVIFLTASSDEKTMQKAKLTGPYAYIIKPFESTDLKFAIEIAIYKHGMEKKLQESESTYQGLFNTIKDAVYIQGDDGAFLDVNEGAVEMYDYPRQYFIGKTPEFLSAPALNDMQQIEDYFALAFSGKPQRFEFWGKRSNGEIFPKEVSLYNGTYFGRDVVIAIAMDITKRKMVEETLEKRLITLCQPLDDSEDIDFDDLFNLDDIQQIQDLFAQATGVASIITKPDGTPLTRPSNFCHLCKNIIRKTDSGLKNCYKSDAIIGRHNPEGPIIQECLSGGLWDAGASITVGGRHIANWLIGQVRNDQQSEDSMRNYAREIGVDPEEFIKAFNEVPIMSQEQFTHIAEFLFAVTNQLSEIAYKNIQQARFITERQQVEASLKESEEKYRRLFDNARDMISLNVMKENGLPGNFIEVNKEGLERLGYTRDEFLDMTPADIIALDKRADILKNATEIENKGYSKFEIVHVNKNGEKIPVEVNNYIFDLNGEKLALAISRDISERKRASLKMEESLKEKELLLKEIHHRVKNNMQIISSLLNLQKRYVDDEDAVNVLKESQNRVKSMAIIHEKLYQSPDLTSIDFSDYIRSLVSDLFYSYHMEKSQIIPIIEIDDVRINIETAVPLGLIISEMVSNSIKYAFPRDKKGEISIYLKSENDKYVLSIGDNGIGLPDTIDFKKTESLGLQLVNSLVKQIDGEIELEKSKGTNFKIKFKELKYEERI